MNLSESKQSRRGARLKFWGSKLGGGNKRQRFSLLASSLFHIQLLSPRSAQLFPPAPRKELYCHPTRAALFNIATLPFQASSVQRKIKEKVPGGGEGGIRQVNTAASCVVFVWVLDPAQ